MTGQLSKTIDVEPDENCQYVLATVSLSDGYKKGAALVMPDTLEGFVGCLDGIGDDTSECTARQTKLLPRLIKQFNHAEYLPVFPPTAWERDLEFSMGNKWKPL